MVPISVSGATEVSAAACASDSPRTPPPAAARFLGALLVVVWWNVGGSSRICLNASASRGAKRTVGCTPEGLRASSSERSYAGSGSGSDEDWNKGLGTAGLIAGSAHGQQRGQAHGWVHACTVRSSEGSGAGLVGGGGGDGLECWSHEAGPMTFPLWLAHQKFHGPMKAPMKSGPMKFLVARFLLSRVPEKTTPYGRAKLQRRPKRHRGCVGVGVCGGGVGVWRLYLLDFGGQPPANPPPSQPRHCQEAERNVPRTTTPTSIQSTWTICTTTSRSRGSP